MTAADDLRSDLHAVQVDVAVLKSELSAHRALAETRHKELLDAIKDRSDGGSVRITPSSAIAWAKAIGTVAAIGSAVAGGVYGGMVARDSGPEAPAPVEQAAP